MCSKVYVEVLQWAISLNLWNSHLQYKIPWYTSFVVLFCLVLLKRCNCVLFFWSQRLLHINHLFVALCHAILNFTTPRRKQITTRSTLRTRTDHNSHYSTGREQITARSTPMTRTDNNSLEVDFKRDMNTEQEKSQVDMLLCLSFTWSKVQIRVMRVIKSLSLHSIHS